MKVFPAHIFNPDVVRARVVLSTISGGVALNGEEDVIATDGGGRWEITYSGISLDTPALLRAWEAWLEHLAGGTVECLVPLLSIDTAPRPFVGASPMPVAELVADHPVFPTSVAYANPHIVAELLASAALRATSLEIEVSQGAAIEGGEKFSIGDHAYRIGTNVSGNVWKISPPLREAVADGAAVNFDWPVVRCLMQPSGDFSIETAFGQFADAEITFVESFGMDDVS